MIYLNNSTTTKVDERLVKIIEKYSTQEYGVATSDYSSGFEMKSKEAVESAKKIIAEKISGQPGEIFFTSGQSESNTQVLRGLGKGHIITTKIEHSSILEACKALEKDGCSVTYLDVDEEGKIILDQLKKSLRKDTFLVTIQHANQEVGTIQEIEKIGKICRESRVLFHVDASQSFLKEQINVEKMNIDLLTIAAHLIHGPKGVGALYARRGILLKPLIYGSRVLDIPGIAGFGEAARLWKEEDNEKMRKQTKRLLREIGKIPKTIIFTPADSLPNILSVGFKFIEGEAIVLYLDSEGIVLSTGSACSGKGLKPSHVLEAMGFGEEDSHGSIRISLSRYTTDEEIDIAIEKLKEVVGKLREMSPIKG